MTDADGDGWGEMNPDSGSLKWVPTVTTRMQIKTTATSMKMFHSCDGDCDDDNAEIGFEDPDGDGYSSCLDDCYDSDVDADMDGIPDSQCLSWCGKSGTNSMYSRP